MKSGYMNLKNNLIKQYREQRAWSQSHLAEITGLSLRTIQRIEKEHVASQESVKALASVFDTTPDEFFDKKLPKKKLFPVLAIASLFTLIIAYWIIGASSPNMLTLDISASVKQLEEKTSDLKVIAKKVDALENLYTVDTSIILKERERTIVKVNDSVQFEITPFFVEEGKILLTGRIIDKEQAGKPVIASPKIITDNHVEAVMIASVEDTGAIYKVSITPHR